MNKQERRRRRKIRRICVTVAVAVLAVLITLMCVRIKTLTAFRGEYVRTVDLTDRVVASAALWLADVEGADVSEDWIREKADELTVDVNFSLDPSAPLSGSFSEGIDPASYAACKERANRLVCDCLRELIVKRLSLVGYSQDITDEQADELIRQALGMPLATYLNEAGINTAPAFDELEASVSRSGKYKIHLRTITLTVDGKELTERFSVSKDTFVINDEGYVYKRVKDDGKDKDEEPSKEGDSLMGFLAPVKVKAATRMPENVSVSVDGHDAGIVRALNASYNNNTYISLRDIAVLFTSSSRPFNLDITGGSVAIMTGEPYADEYEHAGFSEEELEWYPGNEPSSFSILVDGAERKYFIILMQIGDHFDCFMSPMDLAMILDINMEINDDSITIDTTNPFDINPARMEGYGYFDGFNTVVVGDATTGEIFYGHEHEKSFPIASTTKLMTYLLTMDAVSSGAITLDDPVTISEKAAALSGSQDGFVALKAGWQVPVSELILGALLPSSNECALALGEYVGGSEEEFVAMMNEKARLLGFTSAAFYNPNGLPVYTDTVIPAKTQNRMSGLDLFRMCAHILNTYPQIKEVTSLKTARMQTLNRDLKNTNALLYNMDEVNGLKTGTTDKSGACLVTSLTVQGADGPHDLVVVALGAENSQARLRVSELMARYGKNVILGRAAKISYAINEQKEDTEGVVTAEDIVRMVVDYALTTRRAPEHEAEPKG